MGGAADRPNVDYRRCCHSHVFFDARVQLRTSRFADHVRRWSVVGVGMVRVLYPRATSNHSSPEACRTHQIPNLPVRRSNGRTGSRFTYRPFHSEPLWFVLGRVYWIGVCLFDRGDCILRSPRSDEEDATPIGSFNRPDARAGLIDFTRRHLDADRNDWAYRLRLLCAINLSDGLCRVTASLTRSFFCDLHIDDSRCAVRTCTDDQQTTRSKIGLRAFQRDAFSAGAFPLQSRK